MPHNNWGPPRSAHPSISINGGEKFACAAVMRVGDGFTVKPAGTFIDLTATEKATGRRVILSVNRNGIPTLIAALQQADAGGAPDAA